MKNKDLWDKLLSPKRINDIKSNDESKLKKDVRNPFERDSDRIIYSYPFRRLQDKTQVIPLPIIDFVHTRLTHTLEVATVGRSLGKIIEEFLLKEKDIDETQLGHIPAILNAACLAHDIGNPPFGHSGEDSISDFFLSKKGYKYMKSNFIPDDSLLIKIHDLIHFEGNAMGFNLLTKYEELGLNLTCATLGTFTKYPRVSYIEGDKGKDKRWDETKVSQKKYGFFYSDLEDFKIVAKETGLIELIEDKAWSRHPLAFLMEAADDICYRIIDLEDGFRVKLIPFDEAEKNLKIIAEKDLKFKKEYYESLKTNNSKFSYLRALAINVLINECSLVFKDKYPYILTGEFDNDLIKEIDTNLVKAINGIKNTVKEYVYKSVNVLTLEATGYEVLGELVKEFIEASNFCVNCTESYESKRPAKYFDLLPEEYRSESLDYYERYLKIASYVAGMTDRYALNLFQKLKGIKI